MEGKAGGMGGQDGADVFTSCFTRFHRPRLNICSRSTQQTRNMLNWQQMFILIQHNLLK